MVSTNKLNVLLLHSTALQDVHIIFRFTTEQNMLTMAENSVLIVGIERDGHGRCMYRRNPAYALGMISALALLIAQITISVAVCRFCCRKRNPDRARWRTTVAVLCAVLSWFTFLVAFCILVIGASLNNKQHDGYFATHCYVIKTGAFAVGAVLSVATVTLGIISYVIASAVASLTTYTHQSRSIAMTQSHAVPLNPEPLFVPENAYNQEHYMG